MADGIYQDNKPDALYNFSGTNESPQTRRSTVSVENKAVTADSPEDKSRKLGFAQNLASELDFKTDISKRKTFIRSQDLDDVAIKRIRSHTKTQGELTLTDTQLNEHNGLEDSLHLGKNVNFHVSKVAFDDIQLTALDLLHTFKRPHECFITSSGDLNIKLSDGTTKFSLVKDVDKVYFHTDSLIVVLKKELKNRRGIKFHKVLLANFDCKDSVLVSKQNDGFPKVLEVPEKIFLAKFNKTNASSVRSSSDTNFGYLKKDLRSLSTRRFASRATSSSGIISTKSSPITKPNNTEINTTIKSLTNVDSNNEQNRKKTKRLSGSDFSLLLHDRPKRTTKKPKRYQGLNDIDVNISDDDQNTPVEHTDDFTSLQYRFADNSWMTIKVSDYSCLYGDQWINDSLIDFFLKRACERSIKTKSIGEHDASVLTTFFYTKLLTAKKVKESDSKIDYYSTVKRWLTKSDLFKYKYIVMPINEALHWYCAIVYNFPGVVFGRRTGLYDEDDRASNEALAEERLINPDNKVLIFYFDSLSQKHDNIAEPIIQSLIGYANDVLGVSLSEDRFELKRALVPKQQNFQDCGIHVIYNVSQFLENTDKCLTLWTQKIAPKRRDSVTRAIFVEEEREQMRMKLREELMDLEKQQQQQQQQPPTGDDSTNAHDSEDVIEIVNENLSKEQQKEGLDIDKVVNAANLASLIKQKEDESRQFDSDGPQNNIDSLISRLNEVGTELYSPNRSNHNDAQGVKHVSNTKEAAESIEARSTEETRESKKTSESTELIQTKDFMEVTGAFEKNFKENESNFAGISAPSHDQEIIEDPTEKHEYPGSMLNFNANKENNQKFQVLMEDTLRDQEPDGIMQCKSPEEFIEIADPEKPYIEDLTMSQADTEETNKISKRSEEKLNSSLHDIEKRNYTNESNGNSSNGPDIEQIERIDLDVRMKDDKIFSSDSDSSQDNSAKSTRRKRTSRKRPNKKNSPSLRSASLSKLLGSRLNKEINENSTRNKIKILKDYDQDKKDILVTKEYVDISSGTDDK